MKKTLMFASLIALAGALSSCITLGDLTAYGFKLRSEYRIGGNSVICDNVDTRLTYEFDYSGNLSAWSTALVSVQSLSRAGQASFTPSISNVLYGDGHVKVTYVLAPGSSPRIQSRAVVVVPEPTPTTLVVFTPITGTGPNVNRDVDLELVLQNGNLVSSPFRFGNDIQIGTCTFQ
jgi:prepilin-type processing-associated H-X9-DG protein